MLINERLEGYEKEISTFLAELLKAVTEFHTAYERWEKSGDALILKIAGTEASKIQEFLGKLLWRYWCWRTGEDMPIKQCLKAAVEAGVVNLSPELYKQMRQTRHAHVVHGYGKTREEHLAQHGFLVEQAPLYISAAAEMWERLTQEIPQAASAAMNACLEYWGGELEERQVLSILARYKTKDRHKPDYLRRRRK